MKITEYVTSLMDEDKDNKLEKRVEVIMLANQLDKILSGGVNDISNWAGVSLIGRGMCRHLEKEARKPKETKH